MGFGVSLENEKSGPVPRLIFLSVSLVGLGGGDMSLSDCVVGVGLIHFK